MWDFSLAKRKWKILILIYDVFDYVGRRWELRSCHFAFRVQGYFVFFAKTMKVSMILESCVLETSWAMVDLFTDQAFLYYCMSEQQTLPKTVNNQGMKLWLK